MIEVYCDGSATKKHSGWGIVGVKDGEVVYQNSQLYPTGTNQEMELLAAKNACLWAHNHRHATDFEIEPITIYSDSAYVVNCYLQKWWVMWEHNNWRNSKNDPVANKDIWEQLIPFFKMPFFEFKHIKGHSGHIYNELADKLAKGSIHPTSAADLTTNKKRDKIFIELSELLLEYKTNKTSTNETINKIYEIMEKNQ